MPPARRHCDGRVYIIYYCIKEREQRDGRRHKWGSGLRFRRAVRRRAQRLVTACRHELERRQARGRSGTVSWRVLRLDEGGRRRRLSWIRLSVRRIRARIQPHSSGSNLIRAKNSNFLFFSPSLITGEHGLGGARTSRPTREAASSWAAAGASSGGRSRHTAAARRLTEEGGSPRGLSAPALPSPPRAAQRRCGVPGPPRREAAGLAGSVALSWRRRRRGAEGLAGGAEEAAAAVGREAGGIGYLAGVQ